MDEDKPLVWLHGEVKTPPFSIEARIEAGTLLRRLQSGESIGMPQSRPMPTIGKRCHELRITDEDVTWRIVYRTDAAISKKVFIPGSLPKKIQPNIRYTAASIHTSTHTLGAAFLAFLKSKEAEKIFRENGFIIPESESDE